MVRDYWIAYAIRGGVEYWGPWCDGEYEVCYCDTRPCHCEQPLIGWRLIA